MFYVTYDCPMARSQHAMVSNCFSLFSFVDCLYHQTVFFVLVVWAMFSSDNFSCSHCLDNWTLSEGVCLCLLVLFVGCLYCWTVFFFGCSRLLDLTLQRGGVSRFVLASQWYVHMRLQFKSLWYV